MAFQFRRGTDAQRQTITPAEGEPLYTTDTYTLYVGDGSTLGGRIISGGGGGGGSTSTLYNGSYTAQLDASGNLNANMFLAREGGPEQAVGYSFQGDGGYDTGMFSLIDGELQWFGNGQVIFSTTPNYLQLHKYIDMNGQNIDNLNQITFSDNTVQTTAYTINTDQALYTTSSVQFQNLFLSNGNITSDNALNLLAPYIGIISTSTYDIDLYTNNFAADGVEVWLRHNDGVEINTANAVYNWKFTNTGTMRFPDGSLQVTAYTTNTDQALYTTSNVKFNSLDIPTSITFGPNSFGDITFLNRAKIEVSTTTSAYGNVSITVPSHLNGITNALIITNGSEYFPEFYAFDGITLTNSGASDLILGSGFEYITASKDGNIYFGTNNVDGKTTYYHQWKLSDQGGMYFPDNTVQTTAWAGLFNAGSQILGGDLIANGYTIRDVPLIVGGGEYNSIQITNSSTGVSSLALNDTHAIIETPNQFELWLGSTGSNRWSFNTNAMTFPDSSIQTTAWTGTSHILSNGNATVTLNSDGPLELSPNTYISFDPPNPEGQNFYIGILPGGEESATTSSFIYTSGEADFNITVNGNVWFFDRAGNLTLPNGGLITDSNDYNEGLLIKASSAQSDALRLVTTNTATNVENTWTFTTDGGLMFPDTTVQTTAYTTATNGQTSIYARNALPAGIPGMIITISDSGSDTNSPSGNWAPAYWDDDAGLWTYIGNSNSVIAD